MEVTLADLEQSGTKPNLVAKILASKFGFVPDCWADKVNDFTHLLQG